MGIYRKGSKLEVMLELSLGRRLDNRIPRWQSGLCKDIEAGEQMAWSGELKVVEPREVGKSKRANEGDKTGGAIFQRNKKRHFQEPWNIRQVTLSETEERMRNHMKYKDTKVFRAHDLSILKINYSIWPSAESDE